MSMPATSERTEAVSFLNSLLILLVGDLAVLLVFLGLVSKGGWSAGVMLLVGSTVPFIAVGLLRPHLPRARSGRVRRRREAAEGPPRRRAVGQGPVDRKGLLPR